MSGSGGGGFVIDLGMLAIVAAVVVAIGAIAWVVLRH
jgi:hypothetical protein